MRRQLTMALALIMATCVAQSDDALHGNVVLQLSGALPRGESAADLELEFQVHNGTWEERGWGYAVSFSRGFHWPKIIATSGDDTRRAMKVEVEIGPDAWTPGGWALLDIELSRSGKRFTGTYAGSFVPNSVPWPGGEAGALPVALRGVAKHPEGTKPNHKTGQRVAGTLTGALTPHWPGKPGEGHAVPEAGEHPRLAFRKADLPRLKKLAVENPVAGAILAKATGMGSRAAPPRMDRVKNDKFTTQPAVIAAFAYCMTGDQPYAERARTVIETTIFNNPEGRRGKEIKQDIHHAPRLLALALAYDLAYDGWDDAFRTKCTDEIQRRTWELHLGEFEGVRMSGYNPNPWSNHSGIRAACAGLGAMAILGEKNSQGKVMEDAEHIAWMAALDLRRHYLMSGVGTSGNCMEGTYYKKMTAERGLDYFPPAYENVFGRAYSDGPLRDFQFIGDLIEGGEVKQEGWSVGIHSVPPNMMPGFKWLFDRKVGLEGDGSFGIATGLEAPFILALYPYEIEAVPPAECFPWMVPDARKGHWIFRPELDNPTGIKLVLNMRSEVLGGCWHTRAGVKCNHHLTAFGKEWIYGPFLPRLAAVPAINFSLGAPTRSWRKIGERACVIDFDLAPAFYGGVPGDLKFGDTPAAYAERNRATLVDVPGWGRMVDFGVRGTRSMAIDASGASGAPLLIAWVDRLAVPEYWRNQWADRHRVTDDEVKFMSAIGLKERPELPSSLQKTIARWQFPLPLGESHGGRIVYSPGAIKVTGSQFDVTGHPGPASLRGVVASGKISSTLATDDEEQYFVVFTVQQEAPPEFSIEGKDLAARVTIGKRVVRFDNNTLVLE